MLPAGLLSGLLGGGHSSSATQASPFYNDSGIYFRSSDSGGIDAGDVEATSTPRQTTGGIQAVPDSSLGAGFSSGNTSYIFLIIGGIIALGAVLFFAFKK